ncbi:MAG TPA: hypothetical protein VFE36_16310 [Candidatus Baltobacteraceae bacterium]|jgi:hypothetical protein|nr:hypothetical protein [Candidatus Baltobacteraceae bacterium]
MEKPVPLSDEQLAKTMGYFDFDSPPLTDDTLVLTCRRVFEDKQPVRYVSHHCGGDFQFLCGGNEHTDAKEAVLAHAKHILEEGPERLRDLIFLRKGCFAQHKSEEVWTMGNLPDEHA